MRNAQSINFSDSVTRRASLGAQFALYLLLFVVPVLGWAGTNAYGDPVSVFGLFDFPVILGKDTPLSERIFLWHLYGGIVVAAVAVLHAAGALYHRLVKRDCVLARMLPGVEWDRARSALSVRLAG